VHERTLVLVPTSERRTIMFQHPHFYDTLGFQRHAELQATAERRNRLFRRPIVATASRAARVFNLPTAAAAAHGCDARVA
jgi:hypothetical protein